MTPVTIVTGFLGSGKTTLIAGLLRHPALHDTAVIVNEFGEVGLDHALLERADGDIVLLPAGCLCCAANGTLASTLEGLALRRERGEVPAFDRVIVETSGLADPVPAMQTLLDPALLLRGYAPGLTVTTVDAVNGIETLDRFAEAERQVAMADRILLTKGDLGDCAAVRERLSQLNAHAPIFDVRNGRIAPDELIASSLSDSALFGSPRPNALAMPKLEHTHGISTITLRFDQPLEFTALARWLEAIIAEHGSAMMRIKGIVRVRGQERPIAVHGVQHVFHPPKLLAAWPVTLACSTIVFILDRVSPSSIAESALAAGLPILTPSPALR